MYAIIASVCSFRALALISVIEFEYVMQARRDSSRDAKRSAIVGYVVMQCSVAL